MRIPFLAGVKYKDQIIFSALGMNGLFSFDLSTHETQFIKAFEKELIRPYLHIKAFLHQNEMWLIPLDADNIACVNLETYSIDYYPIPYREEFKDQYAYLDGLVDEDTLYVIPHKANNFVKIHMLTHEVSVLCKMDFYLEDWSHGCYIKNGRLYIVTSDGETGLSIDVQTGEYERIYDSIQSSNAYLYSFCSNGEMWMTPFSASEIRRLDIMSGQMRSIPLPSENDLFYRGLDTGDRIIVFPAYSSRNFLVLNKENEEIQIVKNLFDDIHGFDIHWFQLNVVDSDQEYWAASIDGCIFEFSATGDITRFLTNVDKRKMKERITAAYHEIGLIPDRYTKGVVIENEPMEELTDLINYVVRK